MDRIFFEAFKEYYSIVEDKCNKLISAIERDKDQIIVNKFDLFDLMHRDERSEMWVDSYKYFFHGAGCTVTQDDVIIADWDFGFRSWWCGIDPFKMAITLEHNFSNYKNYYDGSFIKEKCEEYLAEEVFFYKGQYYIDLVKLNSIKANFPSEYDYLIIEYKGVRKCYYRNKSVDKFIRKSNRIYRYIDRLKNNYILYFYKDNCEIAHVYYNDIAYPYSAVKIMNGEIIKPHIFSNWK